MRIGELAARAGVSTRSLRYYEKQGLITAGRASNGYREYAESDVRLVREIRALLNAGFSLDDTRPFVACLRAGHPAGDACPESVAVLRRRLAEIDERIRSLTRQRSEFAAQLAQAPACAMTAPGEGTDDHRDDGGLRGEGRAQRPSGAGGVLG